MQDTSVKKLFKEQVGHYSEEDQATDSYIISLVSDWIKKKKFTRKIKICEFGGGAGQLLNEIGKSYPNADLINVELIDEYKRYMVSKKIKLVISSVLDSKLPNNSFDIILMRNVLHHLIGKNLNETAENQKHALFELKRMTKPGGAIFIEELTNPSAAVCMLLYLLTKLNSKLKLRFFSFYINPNAIIYFFTPTRLSNLYNEIFGKNNILVRQIHLFTTDLKSRLLHFGKERFMVTYAITKPEQ